MPWVRGQLRGRWESRVLAAWVNGGPTREMPAPPLRWSLGRLGSWCAYLWAHTLRMREACCIEANSDSCRFLCAARAKLLGLSHSFIPQPQPCAVRVVISTDQVTDA